MICLSPADSHQAVLKHLNCFSLLISPENSGIATLRQGLKGVKSSSSVKRCCFARGDITKKTIRCFLFAPAGFQLHCDILNGQTTCHTCNTAAFRTFHMGTLDRQTTRFERNNRFDSMGTFAPWDEPPPLRPSGRAA